jgi:hypothetical protein
MLIAVGVLPQRENFYSQLRQMPQSCHGWRLTLRHWPRLDLGVTCPSVQVIRDGLRSRPAMVLSQSGCPTGRLIMRLLNLRGRLWRSVYAALGLPAFGGLGAIGSHPASSESQKRILALPKAAPRGGLCFCDASVVMGEKLAPMPRYCPRRQIGNLNVDSESVWGVHEARLASCRVLTHDAAGFVCRRARRAASSRFGRAGADRCDSACREFRRFGKPGHDPSDAACADPGESVRADPGESACGDGNVNSAVHSDEPISADSRAREPVHAPRVAGDADSGDGFGARCFSVIGCAHSRAGRGGAEA